MVATLSFGCAKKQVQEATPPKPHESADQHALELPLSDYVPSVGLRWLVQLRPQTLMESAAFVRDWRSVFAEERVRAFTLASGIDPNRVTEAWLAGYDLGELYVFDASKIGDEAEQAFVSRALTTRTLESDYDNLHHITGIVDDTPHAVIHLRGHAIAIASGDIRLAKIVRARAEGKLENTKMALQSRFLEPFISFESDAPIRAFLSGPFPEADDPVSAGFVSGVAAAHFSESGELRLQMAALGAWPPERLDEHLTRWTDQVLSTRELRALGWGFPLRPPKIACEPYPDDLSLCRTEGSWKSAAVASALHRVTAATMSELMQVVPDGWHPEATTRDLASDADETPVEDVKERDSE